MKFLFLSCDRQCDPNTDLKAFSLDSYNYIRNQYTSYTRGFQFCILMTEYVFLHNFEWKSLCFPTPKVQKTTMAFIFKCMKISQTWNSTKVLFFLQSMAKHLVGAWSYPEKCSTLSFFPKAITRDLGTSNCEMAEICEMLNNMSTT